MKRILLISTAIFLASCGGKPTDKKSELEALKKERAALSSRIEALEAEVGAVATAADLKDVSTITLTETSFQNYLEVQGKVDAEENVQVTPEAPGVITAVFATIGQNVTKGQVLAQIDDQVLRQNISELQNQLDLATTLFERQKNLWDQKIGTEVQYLSAKTQKEAAERRIATVKSQISMYKIKAPITGTIDAMDLKIGQAVSPGFSGIRVINTSKLKAKAQIAESYSSRVNQGDKVQVILPDVPDTVATKITFASKSIDPVSRSFNVEIQLPSNRNYRPNMLAVLKIIDYQNPNALVIPVNSIQKAENGDYVFIVENGKAKRVDIKAGRVSEGRAEVISGLKSGDQVIVSGMQGLSPGDTVKSN